MKIVGKYLISALASLVLSISANAMDGQGVEQGKGCPQAQQKQQAVAQKFCDQEPACQQAQKHEDVVCDHHHAPQTNVHNRSSSSSSSSSSSD